MNKEHVVIMVGAGEFPEHLPMAKKLKGLGHIVCESNDDVDRIRPKANTLYTVVGSISSLCVAKAVKKCLRAHIEMITVPLAKLDGHTSTLSKMETNADNLAWGLYVNNVDLHDKHLSIKPSSVWEKAVRELERQPFYILSHSESRQK